jgi:hypothetical protein
MERDSKDSRCELLFIMKQTSESGQEEVMNVSELLLDAESRDNLN